MIAERANVTYERRLLLATAKTDDMPGPTIIRAAAPRALCETALAELRDAVAAGEQDSFTKYELTPTCAEIARKVRKVGKPYLTPLLKAKTERSSRIMNPS